MMEKEDSTLPSVIVPGPELQEKIDKFAGRLSKLEKRSADEMVAKVLSSPKRNAFLFLDASHIFYPYFLSKLSEFRQHPDRAPEGKDGGAKAKANGATAASSTTAAAAAAGSAAAAAAAASASTTTTTRANGQVRTEGGTGVRHDDPQQEELRRQTEAEARRYLKDPFPNLYSLDLRRGTVEVPALLMDVITCTAQYTAKYGDAFLSTVRARQGQNATFRFLHPDDVRHGVFAGLIASYKRILAADLDTTETRLESLQRPEYVLDTICGEKTKYAKAALARRKAALLTDDELRSRLHWATFKVLQSFTLSDLSLDGPMPVRRVIVARPVSITATTSVTGAAAAAAAATAPAPPASSSSAPPTPNMTSGTATPSLGLASTPISPPHGPGRSGSGTLLPPGGVPSFAPVFMSSSLVTSTMGLGHAKNMNMSNSNNTKGGGRHGRHGAVEVEESYTPQAFAPVRRGVDYFVDAETGERLRADDVQAGSGGGGGGPSQAASELKRDRESLGLASEEEMAREVKRRATEQ